jgi:hypothetical protein
MQHMINVYSTTVIVNPERKKPLGRREYNIKQATVNVDWIKLEQDRAWWRSCERSNEPSGPIKGGDILD